MTIQLILFVVALVLLGVAVVLSPALRDRLALGALIAIVLSWLIR